MRRTGPVRAHRRGCGRSGLELIQSARSDSVRASEHSISTVHIRFDPRAGRCCPLAQECHHQLRTANVRLHRGFGKGSVNSRIVAAVLSRHGVDAGHHSPDDQSRHRGVDESHGILAAAGPLDAIISQTPRTDFQRTEFRFRIGGTQNIRRRYGWT